MNTSTFWKGLALVAVVFLFTALEAAAQLPVRTQTVQWINPAGGTNTFSAAATGATDNPWTALWPEEAAGANVGDQTILLGSYTAVGANPVVQLQWYDIVGFVDGAGAANHVTWWLDDETITYSDNLEWDHTNRIFGVGTASFAPSATNAPTGAAGAGIIHVGDGTDEEIVLDGLTATITVGNGTAGNVDVEDGAGALGVQLDGDGTATLGNATDGGTLVMHDGGGQTATITSGNQIADIALSYNSTLAGAPAAGFLPIATNELTATEVDFILVANADGTATWQQNPSAGLKAGVYTHVGADSYTASVTFANAYAGGVTPSVVVTQNHPTNANILQVTAVSNTAFTVTSTAPITAGDEFNWMSSSPVDLP